ncbi:hypothetical protein [Vogesella sp. LIG4]|uniref:protein MIGRI n=1 Tax=Vogesella sp. LIG4 TaxID=1192162 RepID=UPI00081FF7F9|nr:hypothetical protein [Vogesella sp. LIG4]SCK15266.1 hypothetical protein PSELUDRAFT_1508 [Vogesella sp. LIG4]
MIGRLFRLFLLLGICYLAARWLLSRQQRQHIHRFVRTLAVALLLSAALFVALAIAGIRL